MPVHHHSSLRLSLEPVTGWRQHEKDSAIHGFTSIRHGHHRPNRPRDPGFGEDLFPPRQNGVGARTARQPIVAQSNHQAPEEPQRRYPLPPAGSGGSGRSVPRRQHPPQPGTVAQAGKDTIRLPVAIRAAARLPPNHFVLGARLGGTGPPGGKRPWRALSGRNFVAAARDYP